MNGNAVGWFEIYVQDIERARAFYEGVFGVKLTKLGDAGLQMWAFPMEQGRSGAPGALVHLPGFPSGKNSVIVYFTCDDCAVEEAKAAKAGGRIEKKKFSIGQYGFISIAIDTEGNMIGLHSMR